jgi:hypothetical protein
MRKSGSARGFTVGSWALARLVNPRMAISVGTIRGWQTAQAVGQPFQADSHVPAWLQSGQQAKPEDMLLLLVNLCTGCMRLASGRFDSVPQRSQAGWKA